MTDERAMIKLGLKMTRPRVNERTVLKNIHGAGILL